MIVLKRYSPIGFGSMVKVDNGYWTPSAIAQAEIDRLKDALARIAEWPYDIMGDCVVEARSEARAALDEGKEVKP